MLANMQGSQLNMPRHAMDSNRNKNEVTLSLRHLLGLLLKLDGKFRLQSRDILSHTFFDGLPTRYEDLHEELNIAKEELKRWSTFEDKQLHRVQNLITRANRAKERATYTKAAQVEDSDRQLQGAMLPELKLIREKRSVVPLVDERRFPRCQIKFDCEKRTSRDNPRNSPDYADYATIKLALAPDMTQQYVQHTALASEQEVAVSERPENPSRRNSGPAESRSSLSDQQLDVSPNRTHLDLLNQNAEKQSPKHSPRG